jgi:RNA polymerase sigma-70 factor (ECF subfamily)
MRWQTTHDTLLSRLRNPRDEHAWRRFDRAYGPVIVRYARKRGLSLADAEDVHQIVLVSLLRAMPNFRWDPARGRFRSYLGRVVGNAVERHRGGVRRRMEEPGASPAEDLADETHPEHLELWEREWTEHHLRRALASLDAEVQPSSLAIFRRLLDGASAESVAAETGLGTAAVHKVRQRMRERLRERIERQIAEEARLLGESNDG